MTDCPPGGKVATMSAPITAALVFLVPTGALLAMACFFVYSCRHRTPARARATGRAAVPYQRPARHVAAPALLPVPARASRRSDAAGQRRDLVA
jgi:hypothetical protein